jgi:hypothetical protein
MRDPLILRGLNAVPYRVNKREDALVFFHGAPMTDFLYIAGTICFFALMLAYISGCDRLGRSGSSNEER